MMKDIDNRLICSDEKKNKIIATRSQTRLRRQNQIVKSYELKIVEKRLNKRQHEELDMLFVEGKWFYNHVLNLNRQGQRLSDISSTTIKTIERFDKDRNPIQSELKYLSASQKQAILARMVSNQMTIIQLVKRGHQKFGNLQFKSELNCIPLKQYGQTYSFKSENKVKIQGIHGKVLVRGTHQLVNVDEYANANLIKKPDGYYLKVTCYINKDSLPKSTTNGMEIGLDFGIKTNITTSEGEKLDVSVEESERLKMLQRKLQRQTKGSNNRYKTIKQIRRQYLKLTNKKKDKANKIVHKLKQYDCIVIQDEQLNKWHQKKVDENGKDKNKVMRRIVQHSCMGLIKSKLINLPQTVVLDKYIPTTKWCPRCHKLNELSLNDRTYKCECGYQEDRDIHSAQNMLNIKNLVLNSNLVPTEHREVTLMEFNNSVKETGLRTQK